MRFQKLSNLWRAVKEILVIWIPSILRTLSYPIQIRTFYEMTHAVMFCPLFDSRVCNIPQKFWENSKVFLKLFCFILIVYLIYDFYNTNMHDGITLYNSEVIGVRQNSLGPEGSAQSKKSSVQQRPGSSS